MKAALTRKTRNLEKLIKKIKKLEQANVESGYFPEQGDHPYAEMSYVDLAYIHSKGEGNFPPRDVRFPTYLNLQNSITFKTSVHKDLKNHLYKDLKLDTVLTNIGVEVTNLAKSFFGIPSSFLPMNSSEWAEIKGANTPLVFEGYLMDAWSFKTSELPNIRGT